jgi:hypothetical protein
MRLILPGSFAVLVACAAPASDDLGHADHPVKESSTPGSAGSFGGTNGASGGSEQCTNGKDDDGDGLVDCQDPDCSGIGSCPVCGAVDHPEAKPLSLPDGNDGEGVPYESTLRFKGFGDGKTLDAASGLVKICVTMEHSWLRDLEIALISPSKQKVILTDFRGREGNGILLGKPNTRDDSDKPIPGTGAEYCWAADATNPAMLDAVGGTGDEDDDDVELPPGSYRPVQPLDGFVGSTLNGDWTIRVTDRWSEDNGFIFGWSIAFSPSLVADCSAPLTDVVK